jgi:hypothetical protein
MAVWGGGGRESTLRRWRPSLSGRLVLDVLAVLQRLDLFQVTSPLVIIESRIGRKSLIFASVSTISMISGRS